MGGVESGVVLMMWVSSDIRDSGQMARSGAQCSKVLGSTGSGVGGELWRLQVDWWF